MSDRLILSDFALADLKRIEAEAREQKRAELAERTEHPPAFGTHIAWAVTARSGPTDEFSSVHRVGAPIGGDPHTTCGAAIPDPALWMPLSPALIRSMDRCGFCEAAYARLATSQSSNAAAVAA